MIECLRCGDEFKVSSNYRGMYSCICGAELYLESDKEGKLSRYFLIEKALVEFAEQESKS